MKKYFQKVFDNVEDMMAHNPKLIQEIENAVRQLL